MKIEGLKNLIEGEINLRNQISLILWQIAMIEVIKPIIPAFLAGIVPFQ